MPPAASPTTAIPAAGAAPTKRDRSATRLLPTARLLLGLLGAWLLMLGIVAALGASTVGILRDGSSGTLHGLGLAVVAGGLGTLFVAWALAAFTRTVALVLGAVVLLATIMLGAQRFTALNIIGIAVAALAVGLLAAAPAGAYPAIRRSFREIAPVPVVVVVRRINRVRGTGWVNCPNCHEHASQDIVDEMLFLALLFFRFTPIHRHRVIICRRCTYRRPATAAELEHLNTAGEPIRSAWLFPMGFAAIALVTLVVVFITTRVGTSADKAIAYSQVANTGVAPVTLDLPGGVWEIQTNRDVGGPTPQYIRSSETNGRVELDRFPLESDLQGIYDRHFSDVTNLESTGFPTSPPKPGHVSINGVDALHFAVTYDDGGAPAKVSFYAFVHGAVGYTLTYFGQGGVEGVMFGSGSVEEHVNSSLKFTDQTETALPCATPVPILSPGASPLPSGTPTPQPSGTPPPSCVPPETPSASASASAGASASPSPSP